jgi:hypothetical protein
MICRMRADGGYDIGLPGSKTGVVEIVIHLCVCLGDESGITMNIHTYRQYKIIVTGSGNVHDCACCRIRYDSRLSLCMYQKDDELPFETLLNHLPLAERSNPFEDEAEYDGYVCTT